MNANHCKFPLSLEEGKNKFLFIKINAIWYLHQGISVGMWLEETLKVSFIRCKRKQKEFLKTTCKHPWQKLKQVTKGSFQWSTLSTRKSKGQSQQFYKNWMKEQSHCCTRNQQILMHSDTENNPLKKVCMFWNDLTFVIPVCQSFKAAYSRM